MSDHFGTKFVTFRPLIATIPHWLPGLEFDPDIVP